MSQVFFASVGVPLCFAQLNSNEAVDRAAINRAAWAATLARAWSPHIFFFAGNLQDGGKLYARMWAPALRVEEDPATGSACAALVGAMAIEARFWQDGLSPFHPARCLDGTPKRNRSGGA